MRYLIAALAALLIPAAASAGSIDVRGSFQSLSASAIATELPRSADRFEGLAGQVSGVTLRLRNDVIDAETTSGSLVEFDGWRSNAGGFVGAGGFAGIRGHFRD